MTTYGWIKPFIVTILVVSSIVMTVLLLNKDPDGNVTKFSDMEKY